MVVLHTRENVAAWNRACEFVSGEVMPKEIPKAYEPREIEERWAKAWFDEKLFRAENSGDGSGRTFSIALPPPNVTGSIHIGHMLEHTQIDMLVRWHRMRGERTTRKESSGRIWAAKNLSAESGNGKRRAAA